LRVFGVVWVWLGHATMKRTIRKHTDLDVYRRAFEAAMTVHEISRGFPREEVWSLTDQARRASRSVCANLAEAWRRRRYEASFRSKLNDAEAEAAEAQVWLEFAVRCGYLPPDTARPVYETYDTIIRTLVGMIHHAETWVLPPRSPS
jgi:four helix bundle protein